MTYFLSKDKLTLNDSIPNTSHINAPISRSSFATSLADFEHNLSPLGNLSCDRLPLLRAAQNVLFADETLVPLIPGAIEGKHTAIYYPLFPRQAATGLQNLKTPRTAPMALRGGRESLQVVNTGENNSAPVGLGGVSSPKPRELYVRFESEK